ncbi:MAG: phosphomannomutase/phosphoglucomutase, partial [Myxococcota bacterium]
MKVPGEIFRQYDIRGVVGETLSAPFARALGQSVGTTVRRGGGQRVVVARDGRVSGAALEDAFVDGVRSTGVDVDRIGVAPSPMGYWAIPHLKADGGVVITGSHNPSNYNGFKITLLGRSVWGDGIQALKGLMERDDFESGEGSESHHDLLDAYVSELVENLAPAKRKLKVVVDAGNGVGGLTGVPVFERMGHEVIPLFVEVDGTFPNHHADPTVEENLTHLKAAVAEHQADLGIGFDGDGDRIGVVAHDGSVIWGDRLMILLSRAVLAVEPGATIIGEVKCSKTMYDEIAKAGGKPVMWITGHSLIKEKMKETGAALAGEMSGHIFFKHRYYGFDDATYAGGRLLELLAEGDKSLVEMLADVPEMVSTPELRREVPESIKFAVVEKVVEHF